MLGYLIVMSASIQPVLVFCIPPLRITISVVNCLSPLLSKRNNIVISTMSLNEQLNKPSIDSLLIILTHCRREGQWGFVERLLQDHWPNRVNTLYNYALTASDGIGHDASWHPQSVVPPSAIECQRLGLFSERSVLLWRALAQVLMPFIIFLFC